MRDVIFRGKAINRDKGYHRTNYKNGDWVYGLVTNLYDDDFPNVPAEMRNTDGVSGIEVDYKTVGQYTGLKDKNGKRIFENDIVKADDFIFVVKYGKCGGVANADNYGYMGFYLEPFSESTKLHARYGLRNDICYFDNIEIINNIHDNPNC